MITWIGLCAGEIWEYLDKNGGEITSQNLFASISAPKETIWMALGWLVREGHIDIIGVPPNALGIKLKKQRL